MSRKSKKNTDFIDIEKVRGVRVDLHVGDIIKQNAEIAVSKLKKESPKSKTSKDTRKRYASKWKYTYYPQYEWAVVYNTKSNLTYFLEHGHIIANKKNGAGWAKAEPHIITVFEMLPASMIKIIKETDIDFDIY